MFLLLLLLPTSEASSLPLPLRWSGGRATGGKTARRIRCDWCVWCKVVVVFFWEGLLCVFLQTGGGGRQGREREAALHSMREKKRKKDASERLPKRQMGNTETQRDRESLVLGLAGRSIRYLIFLASKALQLLRQCWL